MDRSGSSHLAGSDQFPWLLGIDGRYRGGITSGLGFAQLARFPGTDNGVGTAMDGLHATYTLIINNNSAISGMSAATTVRCGDIVIGFLGGTPSGAATCEKLATADLTAAEFARVLTTYHSDAVEMVQSGHVDTSFAWVTWRYKTRPTLNQWTADAPNGAVTIDPSSDVNRSTSTFLRSKTDINGGIIDITFAKYVEILKTGNTTYRGFIIRIGGRLYFLYWTTDSSDAAPRVMVVQGGDTADIDWSKVRMSVTYHGRVAYIAGTNTNGTIQASKVLYVHPRYQTLVCRDLGPGTGTVGQNSCSFTFSGGTGNPVIVERDPGGSYSFDNTFANFGHYQFALRYYDPYRQRMTARSDPVTTTLFDDGTGDALTVWDPTLPHDSTWGMTDAFKPIRQDYSRVQVFSSIGATLKADFTSWPAGGFLFKRNEFAINREGIGGAGGDWVYYPATTINPGTPPNYRDSITDDSLVAYSDRYDSIADVVNTTPPAMEQIQWYQGCNFAACPFDGFVDLRWTPLDRIEPENFPALNVFKTKIRVCDAAHFVVAGDVLWLLGDGESYRIQKAGINLSIHRMLVGYQFVGPNAATVMGSMIIGLTRTGLVAINGTTGDVQQVSASDRIVTQRWVNNLVGVKG